VIYKSQTPNWDSCYSVTSRSHVVRCRRRPLDVEGRCEFYCGTFFSEKRITNSNLRNSREFCLNDTDACNWIMGNTGGRRHTHTHTHT